MAGQDRPQSPAQPVPDDRISYLPVDGERHFRP
jgi:hypothetical protein